MLVSSSGGPTTAVTVCTFSLPQLPILTPFELSVLSESHTDHFYYYKLQNTPYHFQNLSG